MPALLLLGLTLGGCGTLHLPDLYVRGVVTPRAAERAVETRFEVGLAAHFAPPSRPPPTEPPPTPLTSSLPCRVSLACAWERRAAAEARARVIGAAP